jgi:hypothetical protein
MRNKLMMFFLVVILISLSSGIAYIYGSNAILWDDETLFNPSEEEPHYIEGQVLKMVVLDELIADGIVASEDEEGYEEIVAIAKDKSTKLELGLKVGDELSPGDILYKLNGKSYTAKNNLRVVRIKETDKELKLFLLNYDNLYVFTEVSYSDYKKMSLNTPVQITFDESTYQGSIHYIDYQVVDNKIQIIVDSPAKMLPGTEVGIKFELSKGKEVLCVLPEFVSIQAGSHYVHKNIGTDGDIILESKEIELGDKIEIQEGADKTYYYEILEGLVEGEKIIAKVEYGAKLE